MSQEYTLIAWVLQALEGAPHTPPGSTHWPIVISNPRLVHAGMFGSAEFAAFVGWRADCGVRPPAERWILARHRQQPTAVRLLAGRLAPQCSTGPCSNGFCWWVGECACSSQSAGVFACCWPHISVHQVFVSGLHCRLNHQQRYCAGLLFVLCSGPTQCLCLALQVVCPRCCLPAGCVCSAPVSSTSSSVAAWTQGWTWRT